MQVRKEFLCFCIGYCFADADTDEVMKSDVEVTALMKVRVGRMLQMFNQHPLTDEEMETFSTVNNWLLVLQKEGKKAFNTKNNC